MKLVFLSYIITLLSSYVKSEWTDVFKCASQTTGFKIGDNTTVCVHFFPRHYRMGFNVTIDEYSVLSIGGGYNFVASDTLPEQSFLFQFGKNVTFSPSLYYSKTNSFVIPVFNVVIKLDKGNVVDVVWDNDCFSCLTDTNCYTKSDVTYVNDTNIKVEYKNCKQALCALDKEGVFQCDPKFYITWFGTDVDGKQLKSANLAMSRFRQYAIGSLYNSAKDAFNDTVSTLQNTWDDVKKKTDEIIKDFETK